MIYLRNSKGEQAVLIPRTVRVFSAAGWQLELSSKANNAVFFFNGLSDSGDFYTYVHTRIDITAHGSQKKLQDGAQIYN